MPTSILEDYKSSALLKAETSRLALEHTTVGKTVLASLFGSPYPGYTQLDWFHHNVKSKRRGVVEVEGDGYASIARRNWGRVAVLGVERSELEEYVSSEHNEDFYEAIAYIYKDRARVGINPDESELFTTNPSDLDERIIAMRLGKDPLVAMMGIWTPDERLFEPFESTRVLEPHLPIPVATRNYTGLRIG